MPSGGTIGALRITSHQLLKQRPHAKQRLARLKVAVVVRNVDAAALAHLAHADVAVRAAEGQVERAESLDLACLL